MLKRKKAFFIIFIMFIFFSATPSIVKAEAYTCSDGTVVTEYPTYDLCIASCSFTCTPVSGSSGSASITNPLGDGVTPQKLIGRLINAALGIVGSIALVMFIYGGFTWMLAAGNAEAVSKGKNILIWSVIGLVIIFSSYALVQFVFTSLGV